MTEYVCITNLNDLAGAIRERNEIERAKLEFEKKMFEFNKQLSIDNVKANTDMARTISEYTDIIRGMNNSLKVLEDNVIFLKQEIDKVKVLLG